MRALNRYMSKGLLYVRRNARGLVFFFPYAHVSYLNYTYHPSPYENATPHFSLQSWHQRQILVASRLRSCW